MSRGILPAIGIGALVAAVALVLWWPREAEKPGSPAGETPTTPSSPPTPEAETIPTLPGIEDVTAPLHSEEGSARQDIAILQQVLYRYRQANGANPEGGLNAAIVERLLGENDLGVRFLPKREAWLSAEGELTDRWGTPYFFHPVSGEHMEIVSAGPDREFWTEDDVRLR